MCNHCIMDASWNVKPPKNRKILRDTDIFMEDVAPSVIAKDPRNQMTKFRPRLEPYELPVPRFTIDRNYVGEPPKIEITVTNLNDSIDEIFLKDLIQKCGTYEKLCVYYHPATNKHLGLARVVFESEASAKACIDQYNGTSIMGKALNVFHDAFGEKCKHIVDEATNENITLQAPPPAVVDETSRTDVPFLYPDHHRYYSPYSVPPSSTSWKHQHQSTVTPIPPNDFCLYQPVIPSGRDVDEKNSDADELEKKVDGLDQSMIDLDTRTALLLNEELDGSAIPCLQMSDNYTEVDHVERDDDKQSNEETVEEVPPKMDLDTRIAMMLKENLLPFLQMDSNSENGSGDEGIFSNDTNICSERRTDRTNSKSSNSSGNASKIQTKEMRKKESLVRSEPSQTSSKDDDEMFCPSLSPTVDEKEPDVRSFSQTIPVNNLTKVDHYKSSITTAVNRTTVELRHILKRDLNKIMIEHMAYKKFESWWDDQSKSKGSATIQSDNTTKVGTVLDTNQLLNNLDYLNTYGGATLGLLCKRIPKLPTFQRIHKVRSPKPKVKHRSVCNSDDDDRGNDNDNDELNSKVSLQDKKNRDTTDKFKYRISKRILSSAASSTEDKTSSDGEETASKTSIKTTSIANETQLQTPTISLSRTNAFGEPMRPVQSTPSSSHGDSGQARQIAGEHSYSLPPMEKSSLYVRPMRPVKSSSNSVLTHASRIALEHSYSLPPTAFLVNHDVTLSVT